MSYNEHFKSNLSTFFLLHGIDFILIGHSLTFHFSFSTFDRYKANVFSSKRERTYDMLLQDIYEKYIVDEHSLESYANTFGGSTSINKLYGNNRKLKDQKVSFFYKKLFYVKRLNKLDEHISYAFYIILFYCLLYGFSIRISISYDWKKFSFVIVD